MIKRITSFVLVISMVLSVGTTAFAMESMQATSNDYAMSRNDDLTNQSVDKIDSSVTLNSDCENAIDISSEVISIDPNLTLTVVTEKFTDYNIVTVSDNQGNISISDSRYSYVIENGNKIETTISETESDVLNESITPFALVPAWQKIRTFTTTIAFEKAIKDLAISTIIAQVKALKIVGYTLTAAGLVKAAYEKPDLRSSKAFYLRRDIYGYTNQYGREGTHTYSLDTKYRKISKTDSFNDVNLKAFLGY